jgi:ribosomal protein L17
MAARLPPSVIREMRPMDDAMLEQHLENLHRGLARVEQILPTLATKQELRTAIAEAVAPLATKDDLGELRRHMDVLHESKGADIRLLAEHLTVAMSKLADK